MLGWYQLQLARRPVMTQVLTTAFLFGTGDVMAQQLVERVGVKQHNYARTGRMVAYGGFVFGPAATQWYKLLSRINLSNPVTTTVVRVGADQTIFAPAHLAFFLSSMAYMEGASPKQRLESSYFQAVKMNWMLWPAVQTVNFNFVPLPYRTVVVNLVSLLLLTVLFLLLKLLRVHRGRGGSPLTLYR